MAQSQPAITRSKTCFTPFSSVFIVNFQQVNTAWDVSICASKQAFQRL